MTPGDLGLLVLRLVVGLTFAAHGAQKAFGWWKGPGWAGWYGGMTGMGFRPANLWAVVSIGAELVGGLLLAGGLLTPFAAMALVGQSVVIVLKVHWAKGFWSRDGGFEFPLSLAAGVLALAGTGPGSASLDAALGLSYSAELRALLIAVGVLGALVALAISRLRPVSAQRQQRHASAAQAGSRQNNRSGFRVLVPGFSRVGGAGVDSRGPRTGSARVTLEGLCPGLTPRPSRIPGSGSCSARTGSRSSPG